MAFGFIKKVFSFGKKQVEEKSGDETAETQAVTIATEDAADAAARQAAESAVPAAAEPLTPEEPAREI
ncbi:fused signal recognition particle receptor, partial [Nitratireductor indicus]